MEREYYIKDGDKFIRIGSFSLLGEKVVISLEEYKELLTIKGRYEELKSQQNIPWTVRPNGTTITYTNTREQDKELTPPYKVTC